MALNRYRAAAGAEAWRNEIRVVQCVITGLVEEGATAPVDKAFCWQTLSEQDVVLFQYNVQVDHLIDRHSLDRSTVTFVPEASPKL